MDEEIKNEYPEIDKIYKGTKEHFFIRVYPKRDEFIVFTIDTNSNEFNVNNLFRFYKSTKKNYEKNYENTGYYSTYISF